MKIWVRSQDKCKLRETNIVNYSYEGGKNIIDCNGYPVGTYATKERCLEIIDEIQSLLFDFLILKDLDAEGVGEELKMKGIVYSSKNKNDPKVEYHGRLAIVYEMPKE